MVFAITTTIIERHKRDKILDTLKISETKKHYKCFFFVVFPRFYHFPFGPSLGVANRLPSWREWTNQRASSMNIHES